MTERHEQSFQQECITHYDLGREFETSLLFHVPNGESRSGVSAGILTGCTIEDRLRDDQSRHLMPRGLGVVPGVVDLVLMTAAGLSLLECKRPDGKGRLNYFQALFRYRAVEMGYYHRVIHDLGHFHDILIERGVRMHAGRPWGPGIAPAGTEFMQPAHVLPRPPKALPVGVKMRRAAARAAKAAAAGQAGRAASVRGRRTWL